MLVFCENITPRVHYIFSLLLHEMMGVSFTFTSDERDFQSHKGPGINYSKKEIQGKFRVVPVSLLFETGIKDQDEITRLIIQTTDLQESAPGLLKTDIFALAFYLVTRYEEYLAFTPDMYGRFEAGQSVLYKGNKLDIPWIDKWGIQLGEILMKFYPGFRTGERTYRFQPTWDIDQAFSYKAKGLYRTLGGMGRSLFQGDFRELGERFAVLSNRKTDPFDVFNRIEKLHEKEKNLPVFFILLADYGKQDKNNVVTNPRFIDRIKKLTAKFPAGIHLSFQSNFSDFAVPKEMKRLEKITGRAVSKNRQHYLMLFFPATYERLMEHGIQEDYSMGYASRTGFRAGTCTPFLFYNIHLEETTSLRVYPFPVMDVTLKDYLHVTPEQAIDQVKKIIDEVKNVQGTFIPLWHNESLSETEEWKGWRRVYTEMLKYARV